jgi:hypothetical protein
MVHQDPQGGSRVEFEHLALLFVHEDVARTEEIGLAGGGDLVGPVAAGIVAPKPAGKHVPVVRTRTDPAGQTLVELSVVGG